MKPEAEFAANNDADVEKGGGPPPKLPTVAAPDTAGNDNALNATTPKVHFNWDIAKPSRTRPQPVFRGREHTDPRSTLHALSPTPDTTFTHPPHPTPPKPAFRYSAPMDRPASPHRPNVLWVSFEDSSPRFGCYGDPHARTPHLDALADAGCLYPNAFSSAPVCAPSRHAIITGVYATFSGAHHMRTTHTHPASPELPTPYDACPPPYVKCITEYFRAAGYYCANNAKTDYQFEVPRSAWDDCSTTAHWRNRPSPDTPFFAVFNLNNTHESGMWAPDETGKPDIDLAGFDPAGLELPPDLPDTPEVRLALARHYANLHRMDARLGELLAQLHDDGLDEDTLVVVWSDHGEGLPRRKRWPTDSGTRIPLVVRFPGRVRAGSSSDELVSLIDLPPTMLSLCGLPLPVHLQGRVFLGPDRTAPREYVFATRDRHDESYDKVRSVRDTRFRYVRNYYPNLEHEIWVPYRNRHPAMKAIWSLAACGELPEEMAWFAPTARGPEALYDTRADPHELRNLADDPEYRDVLQRLRDALDDWQSRFDPYLNIPETDMVRAWYGGTAQPLTAKPLALLLGDGLDGRLPVSGDVEVSRGNAPAVLLQLTSATEGASIIYATRHPDGTDGPWKLYAGLLRLPPGGHEISARAIRYGYRESDTLELRVVVR